MAASKLPPGPAGTVVIKAASEVKEKVILN